MDIREVRRFALLGGFRMREAGYSGLPRWRRRMIERAEGVPLHLTSWANSLAGPRTGGSFLPKQRRRLILPGGM